MQKNVASYDIADVSNTLQSRFCGMPINAAAYHGTKRKNACELSKMPRVFQPKLPGGSLNRLLRMLGSKNGRELVDALRERAAVTSQETNDWSMEETAILLTLADLGNIGWKFSPVRETIYMVAKSVDDLDQTEAKAILQESLRTQRDEQLSEKPIQVFLEGMHRQKTFNGNLISIDRLIDDGSSLVKALEDSTDDNLSNVIDPYLQLVETDAFCEHTGLRQTDIWRYFRHTWSLEYRSTPGRLMWFLVRNKARDFHPVMGIIGIANAVFQMRDRDNWIGWTINGLIERTKADPEYWEVFRKSALSAVEDAVSNIRSDDLMKECGKAKTPEAISQKLRGIADAQAALRKTKLENSFKEDKNRRSNDFLKNKNGSTNWKKSSETPLFKKKRAETLADLVTAKYALENFTDGSEALIGQITKNKHSIGLKDETLDRAIRTALREIKKNGVSTRIMDVNVCGASPVYRQLLGGKLAAYSLFSEDVQKAYQQRYGKAESEIASAMAGRPIVRRSQIVLFTTTSLYGVGSSQYNRVKMTHKDHKIEWQRIGSTEGFGTVHLSKPTIQAIRKLNLEREAYRKVNNQFGEGTSPLLRQLRDGLNRVGFSAHEVLQHSQPRLAYALLMYPEAKDDLCLDRVHDFNLPSMSEVASFWVERWLKMRVKNKDVLERVAQQNPDSVKKDLQMILGEKPEKLNLA